MIKCTPEQTATPPDDTWVRATCAIGQGAKCCRFLLLDKEGWECAKLNPHLHAQINLRVLAMNAKADNCTGRSIRE